MSFQILDFNFTNKKIIFSKDRNFSEEHTFTVITGKNASGKSRLLASIITRYLTKDEDLVDQIYRYEKPQKIIAVSNIKNDKFPIKRRNSDLYEYIGSNSTGLVSTPFSDRGYIFKSLLCNENLNLESVRSTFSYLGFLPTFKLDLNFSHTDYLNKTNQFNIYSELIEENFDLFEKYLSKSLFERLYSYTIDLRKISYFEKDEYSKKYKISLMNEEKSKSIDNISSEEKIFLDCLNKIYNKKEKITPSIFETLAHIILYKKIPKNISRTFSFHNEFIGDEIDDIKFLLKYDLLKIRQARVFTTDDKELRYYDLSSGQQALFNIFLGISAVIRNNSLICIDEPEVNLHPEWQTEFILKLQNIFKNYKGCHFIIATHSPQVVSGLNSKFSYVVDLENNLTHSTQDYSQKSADFQLAKVFSSPGYKNEYLIRIGLTLLSKLTQKLEFSDEDHNNLKFLNESKNDLPENDVVYYLVNQINALV